MEQNTFLTLKNATKADSEPVTEEDEEKEPTILTKWKKWLNSLVNDVTE